MEIRPLKSKGFCSFCYAEIKANKEDVLVKKAKKQDLAN